MLGSPAINNALVGQQQGMGLSDSRLPNKPRQTPVALDKPW